MSSDTCYDEVLRRAHEHDTQIRDASIYATQRLAQLWSFARKLRDRRAPTVQDHVLEILVELAYCRTFPLFRSETSVAMAKLFEIAGTGVTYLATRLAWVAENMDGIGEELLATEDDWVAWMEALEHGA